MPTHTDEPGWLRHVRTEAGLRQADLANLIGLARSSISNLEGGRQGFTPEVRLRLAKSLPGWLPAREQAEAPALTNASLVVNELTIAYVFEEHESPSEIVQIRRITAVRSGPNRYGLALGRTDQQPLGGDTAVLWGGFLEEEQLDSSGQLRTSLNFGRDLRRGESHEFAIRTWIERDGTPDTQIDLDVTRPTAAAHLHLAFHGRRRIRYAWSQVKGGGTGADEPLMPLALSPDASVSAHFHSLTPGHSYHLAWRW